MPFNRLNLLNFQLPSKSALTPPLFIASGTEQLQANPLVACPRISPGKSTRIAVTTMRFNDLEVGDVHLLGPSCQR